MPETRNRVDPETTALLVRRLHEAGDRSEWYQALILASLADGAGLRAAIADADAAFAEDPEGGDDDGD